MRQRIDPRSPEPKPLDLSTPEGKKIGLAALNGFAALVKLAMDEWGEPDASRPIGVVPWGETNS